MPAPRLARSSPTRSKTVAFQPIARSQLAVNSPPIEPPMTNARFFIPFSCFCYYRAMDAPVPQVIEARPSEGMVTLAHVLYALHGFSALMGVLGSALIVATFLTGWPSIIAVIINYVKRGDARGTYLDSHFSWQIRTFWWAVLWVVIGFLLIFTIIGIPFAWVLFVLVGLWVLYRIIRGWIALADARPTPMPDRQL